MHRVLLIDDDKEVLQINGAFLIEKGFNITLADSVSEAVKCIWQELPDCIVMDVMMPNTDGFEGLRQIREICDVPVLFLTGRTSPEDRIKGLSIGADDYIVKPCSLEELSLRIMIHIRRHGNIQQLSEVLDFSPLRINLITRHVYYNKEEIVLSNREFDLLACLARHCGEVMTFSQIGNEIFGGYIDADRKNIMVVASRLRKKLESYAGLEYILETKWGKGYCFRG